MTASSSDSTQHPRAGVQAVPLPADSGSESLMDEAVASEQPSPEHSRRRESDRTISADNPMRATGASAANAMQMRRRAHETHRLLAPLLAATMLVAAWVVSTVNLSGGGWTPQNLPGLLIIAVIAYQAVLWAARKSYPAGVASRWVAAIHGVLLTAAALFGGSAAAAAAAGASASDMRLLALTAFTLCGAALPTLAALERVYRIFLALVMIPLLAVMLTHSPADQTLNVVFAAAIVILFTGHAALADTLHKAFRADVEQRALLQRLRQANQVLSADRVVLETESRTDPLTGLANRRYLERRLRAEWNRCRRSNAPLSCVMLDIDHFKAYNDHYGHDGGDRCLKLVADTLSGSIRRAGDVVARYGGEEFVVLLPETGSAGAATVADLLKRAVAGEAIEHLAAPSNTVLSLSLGVATLMPDSDRMPDELLKAADLALYEAKRTGRNRVVMADEQTLNSARLTARGLIG